MRAVVMYESMFGNTHAIADAIGEGMEADCAVEVIPVTKATPELLEGVGLVVVGGPTHAHSMSRPRTRRWAASMARKHADEFVLDPDAEGTGLNDWLASLGRVRAKAAAFDTRLDGLVLCTGRASKVVDRRLRRHGFEMISSPESFVVTKNNRLARGEESRARRWGAELGTALESSAPRDSLAS